MLCGLEIYQYTIILTFIEICVYITGHFTIPHLLVFVY